MSSRRHLEILHCPPANPLPDMPPLIFVHGAYVGAWCWQDHFLPWFADLGYDCYALSLSGHAGSGGREKLDHFGLSEFLSDIARVAAPLHQAPVIIGHSLGGYLAQRYARKHPVAGLALLASVAPWGLMNSLGHMVVASPHLLMGLNQFQWHTGAIDIDLGVLKQLLFSHDTPRVGLNAFAARIQPESALALAELMMPQPWFSWGMPDIPVLVLGAGEDRIIPAGDVRSTAHAWRVEAEFLPGLGHALMCDTLWEHAALRIHGWLNQQYGARR